MSPLVILFLAASLAVITANSDDNTENRVLEMPQELSPEDQAVIDAISQALKDMAATLAKEDKHTATKRALNIPTNLSPSGQAMMNALVQAIEEKVNTLLVEGTNKEEEEGKSEKRTEKLSDDDQDVLDAITKAVEGLPAAIVADQEKQNSNSRARRGLKKPGFLTPAEQTLMSALQKEADNLAVSLASKNNEEKNKLREIDFDY